VSSTLFLKNGQEKAVAFYFQADNQALYFFSAAGFHAAYKASPGKPHFRDRLSRIIAQRFTPIFKKASIPQALLKKYRKKGSSRPANRKKTCFNKQQARKLHLPA
jgi:hypothetical protein